LSVPGTTVTRSKFLETMNKVVFSQSMSKVLEKLVKQSMSKVLEELVKLANDARRRRTHHGI
jgi:mRNA-degrading endonuclease RelE of RelBE toxin-antitoxin system